MVCIYFFGLSGYRK